MNTAIKYRIYPTTEQEIMFAKTFGCCRKVYNLMLSDKIDSYKKTGKFAKITPAQYKTDYPYLKEVDSLALANVQLLGIVSAKREKRKMVFLSSSLQNEAENHMKQTIRKVQLRLQETTSNYLKSVWLKPKYTDFLKMTGSLNLQPFQKKVMAHIMHRNYPNLTLEDIM